MAFNTETEAITSYRRTVNDVFVSQYHRIRSVLKGSMEDFASRAHSKRLTSSPNMKFASIFKQFRTGFEWCRSISEIQQRYERFIDILLDIGGPVGDAGKEIEEKLSSLTVPCHSLQEGASSFEPHPNQENTSDDQWQPYDTHSKEKIEQESEKKKRVVQTPLNYECDDDKLQQSQLVELTGCIKRDLKLAIESIIHNKCIDLNKLFDEHKVSVMNTSERFLKNEQVDLETQLTNVHDQHHLNIHIKLRMQKNCTPNLVQRKLIEHLAFFRALYNNIDPGSDSVKIELEANYLIAFVQGKPQFLHLVGIFHLVINDVTILKEKENINFSFDSALLEAAKVGHIEATQVLLEFGANIDVALNEAKKAENSSAVEFLSKWGNPPTPNTCIDISQLDEILQILKKSNFSPQSWFSLGLNLGLSKPRLNYIEAEHNKNASQCLQECLSQWLSKADKVIEKGEPTWDSLASALRNIGEVAAAESIEIKIELSHQACQILLKHYEKLRQLVLPVEILYTEEVISKEIFHEINRSGGVLVNDQFNALCSIVSEDTEQLKLFASVLLQSKETTPVAEFMLHELKLFTILHQSQISDMSSINDQKTGKETTFDQMRKSFGILFNTIACLIEDKVPSLKDLKTYLHMYYNELRLQLEYAESFEGIMLIIKDKCTIIDIDCLQTVVNHFNIEEAKDHITDYQQAIEEFCEETKLNVCYNECFNSTNSSLLKCETIEFVLEWNGDEHSLNDIKVLLQKAFQEMANRIQVRYIKEGIIVTCYAPQHIMNILLMETAKILDQLRGNGLMKLTIGHHIVYDVYARDKEVRELEKENALLKEKLNSSKQEEGKDVNNVKVTSDEELEPVKYKRKEEEKNTLKEVEVSSSMDRHDLVESLSEKLKLLERMNKAKTLEIEKLSRQNKEATDKVLVEKQEEIVILQEKITRLNLQLIEKKGSRVPLLYDGWKAELQSPPVQTVMSNFNYYKNSDEEWYSPSFLSHSNGYQMCVRIAANGEDEGQGTHLSLYIHLMAGKNDDKLSWPFRGEVNIQLINHRDDHDHYEQNIVFDDSSNVQACSRVINGIPVKAGLANRVGEGKALFIGQDKLQTSTSDFVCDSIKICIKQVIVHSSPPTVPSTLTDPLPIIHDFVIENFSKRKQSNEECISESFYSDENGYEMSLLVYPNGRDKWKNKYVSMFVHLMKGENDNKLTFPFRGDILVQIVNLRENKSHIERLVEFNEKTDPREVYGARVTGLAALLSGRQYRGYGFPKFLSHKFLEFDKSRNTQYVSDDDTLHVRIMKITLTT